MVSTMKAMKADDPQLNVRLTKALRWLRYGTGITVWSFLHGARRGPFRAWDTMWSGSFESRQEAVDAIPDLGKKSLTVTYRFSGLPLYFLVLGYAALIIEFWLPSGNLAYRYVLVRGIGKKPYRGYLAWAH
jgi:hypothetical protein